MQAAASVVKYLREVVVPQLPYTLPSDLTPAGLNMFENIMCAQVRPHDRAGTDRRSLDPLTASLPSPVGICRRRRASTRKR
jgi:hypothetical protein